METQNKCKVLLKSDLKIAYKSQQELVYKHKEGLIPRNILHSFRPVTTHIEIISGIRRCGKSTLLLQIIKHSFPDAAYFNFEDPQTFGFDLTDFVKLLEIMGNNRQAYFFDEIQTIAGWEVFIRSLHDKGKKIFITGSNATMLSKELGTRLTGRYLQHELFPFAYSEFLQLKHAENHEQSFLQYLNQGGFPEFLNQQHNEVLHQLFRDILFRDIAIRHGIKNSYELERLTLFLLSNIAKETTFNRLRKMIDIASTTTVSSYVGWLQDCYLLFLVPRFSYSAKAMMLNPKKVYAIDTGLVKSNTLSRSDDIGRLFENAVFLYLKQSRFEISYFKEKGECDFILFKRNKFVSAIQVCANVNSDNIRREINGLVEALQFFNQKHGIIITLNQEDLLIEQDKKINFIPAWKFFIDNT